MDKVCIVCGAAASRITEHMASGESAAVCSTAHARKWKRSVRRASVDPGTPPAPATAEGRRHVDKGQLTFLGGKPVGKR